MSIQWETGSDPFQGELQAYVSGTWKPQLYMNSVTANKIYRSLRYRMAVRTFEYNGSDTAFDAIYCDGISDNCNCAFILHTQVQLCRSSKTKELVCSNGEIISTHISYGSGVL